MCVCVLVSTTTSRLSECYDAESKFFLSFSLSLSSHSLPSISYPWGLQRVLRLANTVHQRVVEVDGGLQRAPVRGRRRRRRNSRRCFRRRRPASRASTPAPRPPPWRRGQVAVPGTFLMLLLRSLQLSSARSLKGATAIAVAEQKTHRRRQPCRRRWASLREPVASPSRVSRRRTSARGSERRCRGRDAEEEKEKCLFSFQLLSLERASRKKETMNETEYKTRDGRTFYRRSAGKQRIKRSPPRRQMRPLPGQKEQRQQRTLWAAAPPAAAAAAEARQEPKPKPRPQPPPRPS